jgi:hypothetical protein
MPVDFLGLFVLLNGAGVPYVVTGGLAVVLHGVDRLTADVDLAIDLTTGAPRQLVEQLTTAGYRPAAPVDPLGLADDAIRSAWIEQRGMKVFSFWDRDHRRPTIDVMLDNPVPFGELYERSGQVTFRATPIRIASIRDLIRMKQYAGRPQDIADIVRLEEILKAEHGK